MKHILRQWLLIGLALILMGLPITAASAASQKLPEADLSGADTVLLYCMETDTILREKNADAKIYPATAVKLMTALVAYEQIPDLDTPITVTGAMLEGVSGSYYGFKAGDTVSPRDLLILMLLRKSNDAALILAHVAAGDAESFVALMNARADQLGMKDTRFTSPTGLYDAAMTSTAKDLLLLSLAVRGNADLHSITGADHLQCESLNRRIFSDNYFLSNYYNGGEINYLNSNVDGLINGKTDQAGDVLITSAVSGGLHYIVVLLGGKTVEDVPACYGITNELLQKDTRNFSYQKVLHNADVICELPVKLGSGADHAAVFAKDTLEYYLPRSLDAAQLERKIKLTVDSLEAPVHEGQVVGSVEVYYGKRLLGKTDLIVRSNIIRSGAEYRLSQIADFIGSSRFVILALSLIGIFLLYFIANAIYREQVKKYRARHRE